MRSGSLRIVREKGAALPLVAGMLSALLGITALAVDLGWFYLNASRIQRAAEAGALGGVINMPDHFDQAEEDAKAITKANGYDDNDSLTTVTVEEVPGNDHQLQVTVTNTVDTFFSSVMGFDSMTITRSARASHAPPLRLGSPLSTFGNTCDPDESSCSGQPNFWANIQGKWVRRQNGDAYAPACDNGAEDDPNCPRNAYHRERGYLYGIDPKGNSTFEVTFIDLAFHNESGAYGTSNNKRTGDKGCGMAPGDFGRWGDDTPECGPTMEVTLYAPDPDPLDLSNNPVVCHTLVAPRPQVAENAPYTKELHAPCFAVHNAINDIYVVEVKIADPGTAVNRSALNRYSIQSSPGTALFALQDMSIFTNFAETTEFHVAEVTQEYAGTTFVVEMFDPGEGASGDLQMIDPSGSIWTGGCRIYVRDNPTSDWAPQAINPSSCQEHVDYDGSSEYNDKWLRFEMDLPSDYTCSDCWWKVNYNYNASDNPPRDSTTWKAYIKGNPIRLVPTS